MPQPSEDPVDETSAAVTGALDQLFGRRPQDAVVVVPVDDGREQELLRAVLAFVTQG